jgi:hypothetical protein
MAERKDIKEVWLAFYRIRHKMVDVGNLTHGLTSKLLDKPGEFSREDLQKAQELFDSARVFIEFIEESASDTRRELYRMREAVDKIKRERG